jgi:DNA primase
MEIQEIKQQLNILTVLAKYGLKVNKNKHINCPFHADKTPSMKVYEETNTVYCFSGNCGTHGKSLDVIEFIMQQENCSRHESIMKCKELLGFAVEGKESMQTKIWNLLKKSMSSSKTAKSYLKSRGLSHQGVGYNSGLLQKGKHAQEIELVGLKDWGKNCIIYPLKNGLGQVVSFYARGLVKNHFYQAGRAGLYPGYPNQGAKKIIITESIIDAHTLGVMKSLSDFEILALYGTNGLTKEHEKSLQSCEHLEEVILMLDGDAAGEKAAKKYQELLAELLPKVSIKIVELPKETDINELWVNHFSEDLFLDLLKTGYSLINTKQKAVKIKQTQVNKLNTDNPNNLIYKGKQAVYYIKGFATVKNMDSLKITLVSENEYKKYRGKVELYEDTAVQKYCKAAGLKLDIEPSFLDLDISLLTDELEQYREVLESSKSNPSSFVKAFSITPQNRATAQSFLKEKDLFTRLNILIGQTGIVGEERTRLLLFIVSSSYKCKDPLHALIQGASGTGKTLLLRKVMSLLPEQDYHIWTRISDKSLYHAGSKYKHKAIAVEDWDGLSEEVQYVIRELQSGQILRSSITEKQADGKMDSREITTQGPIASLMCTTKGAVYEDNMSRCFLVAVDESEQQTNRILEYQYQKDRGEIDKEAEAKAVEKLQNLVYLLQPKIVVNPYAGKLVLPTRVHKIRRLNDLFQTFVRQITWLHQLQRKQDAKGRIIATKTDLKLAIDLLFETIVLKVDELDGSLRKFFEDLKSYILEKEDKNYCFGRREIRQALGIRKSQLHNYIQALIDLDYIQQSGGYANKGFFYKIAYWDDNQALRKEIQNHLTEQLKVL